MAKITGKVKWFSEKKGYGFLTSDDGADTFVHYTGIKSEGFKTLKEGEKVSYDIVKGKNGDQADNVTKL